MYTASSQLPHTPHPFFARFSPTDPSPSAPQTDSFSSIAPSSSFTTFSRPCSTISEEESRLSPTSTTMDATHPSNPVPIPQSLSPPSPFNPVSLSPAAMFLSSFSSPVSQRQPDDEGEVVAGYILGETVGYGGFSIIRKAFSRSGGTVAVKIVRQSELHKQPNPAQINRCLQREAATWASLSHEHILPLFSAHHTSYADFFFTLFCPAGSLFEILKRDGRPALPRDDVGMMFRQVVRGLRYLHEVALFVHRDIKLENVLVDEMGVCRIGDFGMTRKIGEIDEDDEAEWQSDADQRGVHRAATLAGPPSASTRYSNGFGNTDQYARNQPALARHRYSTSFAKPSPAPQVMQPGSLPYASPELLLPQTAGPLLPHPAQDIWALGVMLYALLTGRLPFNDTFEPRLQMKIINGAYEVPSDIGRNAQRVLKGCLERSVPNRWSTVQVDEAAWSVGWGTASEDVATEESEEEAESQASASTLQAVEEVFMDKEEDDLLDETPATTSLSGRALSSSRNRPSAPPSRSQSRQPSLPPSQPEALQNSVWQNIEGWIRPSLEAASRRSTSRAQRSKSRAPILGERSSSIRGATNPNSRSMSRHQSCSRAPSPSFAALNVAVLGTEHPSMPSYRRRQSQEDGNDESALVTSPSSSVMFERGRKPKKLYSVSSRSPSPSEVPVTPVDYSVRFSGIAEHHNEDDNEDVPATSGHRSPESSRGRRRYNVATHSLHHNPTVFGADLLFTTSSSEVHPDALSELHGIETPSRWPSAMDPTVKSPKSTRLHSNLKPCPPSLLGSGSMNSLSPVCGQDDFHSLSGEAAHLESMFPARGASSRLLTERWLEDARIALRRAAGLRVDVSSGVATPVHSHRQRPESTPPTPLSSRSTARSRSRRRVRGGASRRQSPAPSLYKYGSAIGANGHKDSKDSNVFAIPGERDLVRGRKILMAANDGLGLRRSRSLGFEPKKKEVYHLRCV